MYLKIDILFKERDMIDNEPVLNVNNLSIFYNIVHAVQNISFNVNAGEIYGLLGPNGAGKTSTLSAIEGLLKPQTGTIIINGINARENPLLAHANMGVQLQATSFQPELNIKEILKLYAGIYGVEMPNEKLEKILQNAELSQSSNKRFSQLSGGQQQRVSLIIGTIHNPKLVLLDEPTSGLDPQSRRKLWQHLDSIREKGHAILLTTHSMEEAESVCDRIAIIDHGKIITIDTPQNLIDNNITNPDVLKVSRKGRITLEDVFIGLTGDKIRN